VSKAVVFNKIGSLINRPDWRYNLFASPTIKLNAFIREEDQKNEGGYLKRFVTKDNAEDMVTDNCQLTEENRLIYNALSGPEKEIFYRIQVQRLRELNLKKRSYIIDENIPKNKYCWKVKDLNNIKDEYVQKIIRHLSSNEYNENIEFALAIKFSKDHDTVFRYIGYCTYLGQDHKVIAKNFQFRFQQIEAIQKLFFDFSNRPRDVVANAAYLRQMVHTDVMNQVDFEFYKMIEELGEIGLKARSNIHSLSNDEKAALKAYLSYSMIENVLNIKVSIRNIKDALSYNSVINSYNGFNIAQENLRLLKAREENLIASTEKIRTLNVQSSSSITKSDEESLAALDEIKRMSFINNAPPAVKSLQDLQN